jgi:Zn-dependent protease with chaperone function
MSSIFKVLASTTALLLFISGCVALISRAIVWFDDIGFTGTDTSQLAIDFFVIIALFVASVVVMRLRQKME